MPDLKTFLAQRQKFLLISSSFSVATVMLIGFLLILDLIFFATYLIMLIDALFIIIILIIMIIIIIIIKRICMVLLLPNFPDFWQHLYHLVLLLRCGWYFCYGYGTFATRWDYCCEIRKRFNENIIGSNMDDRGGET